MIRHTRALSIRQASLTRDLQAMFQTMANELRGVLLRYADDEGIIDPARQRAMRTDAASVVIRYFVGVDRRNAYTDNNVALSRYASILNKHIALVTADVVLAHTKWLLANVPADVFRWLANGVDPVVQEQMSSNPLARYEHSHRWLDSRGYVLSDRIWQAGERTRRNIDTLLATGVQNGQSAVEIANLLERYVLPNRAPIRTRTPYGRDGSFDARRLARSEITLAHSRASLVSAGMNPFVQSMNYNLSISHPRYDICDPIAAGSPYAIETCPTPVLDTHPHCVLPNEMVTTDCGDYPIHRIKSGDNVLTHNGNFKTVLETMRRYYDGDVVKIKTGQGELPITTEHPVLTSRGWVNAESLQIGDNLLYTSVNIGLDFFTRETVSRPTKFNQSPIAQSIMLRVVPIHPVAFDSDKMLWKCKIYPITQDGVLFDKWNIVTGQSISHHDFDATSSTVGLVTLPTTKDARLRDDNLELLSTLLTCDSFSRETFTLPSSDLHLFDDGFIVHGVVLPLVDGNLFASGGLFSGVVIPTDVPSAINPLHKDTGSLATCSIIMKPSILDRFTHTLGIQPIEMQNITETSKCDTELFTYSRCTELFSEVQSIDEFTRAFTELFSQVSDIPLRRTDIVNFGVHTTETFEDLPAEWANFVTHDNLLSSSPDIEVGAASGNAGVSATANRTQALYKYTTIEDIEVYPYIGTVYNLHVADDNTFLVNRHITHNCMCNISPNIGNLNDIVEQLRADMANGQPAILNPSNARRFLKDLLEEVLFSIFITEALNTDPTALELISDVAFGLLVNRVEI